MRCEQVRPLLSAQLDGEDLPPRAGEHLSTCGQCQAFAADLTTLRRAVRIETLGSVPDVSGRVLANLPRRTRGRRLVPAAGFVAGALAGALVGALLVGGPPGPLPSFAAPLPESVVAAQPQVKSFTGSFTLTERITPSVIRSYVGELSYRSPESLYLQIEQTAAPAGWADNSIQLAIDNTLATIEGPFPCPALDGCRQGDRRLRAISGRDPFSSTTVAPLDLVVPASIFRGAREPVRVGEGVAAGQPVIGVEITAAQAEPVLSGLFQAGNWREIHQTDRVTIWLHRDYFTPLAITVLAGGDPDREKWAVRRGYQDSLTEPYLELTYTEADFDRFRPFQVEVGEEAVDAGFRPVVGNPPPFDPGLPLVGSGRLEGAVPVEVWAWSDGRAWLRLDRTQAWTGPGLFGSLGGVAGPVAVGDGLGYLTGDGSTLHLHGEGVDLALYGSLQTDQLIELAGELEVLGLPAPPQWPEGQTTTDPPSYAYLPDDLEGYATPLIRVVEGTVTVDLMGTDKRAVRLTQSPAGLQKPPFDPDARTVNVRGTIGRFSPQLGLLEWSEAEWAFTLSSTSLTVEELVSVAESLRQP